MILCDIGNSTFHFKTSKKDFKTAINTKIKELPDFKRDEKIYFISVNEKGTKKLLKKYPDAVNIETLIDFKTKYEGMGVDRKVVCSGIKNGIIIDAGSAVTVDIMKNGRHLGGYIMPGLGSYRKIYPQISKKLQFDFKNDINLDKIPLKTNSAICFAMFDGIVQSIKRQYDTFLIPLYFTGGDGKVLIKYFKGIPKEFDKNLIFKSMKKIIKNKKRGK
jgi:type III pantothenate kinase